MGGDVGGALDAGVGTGAIGAGRSRCARHAETADADAEAGADIWAASANSAMVIRPSTACAAASNDRHSSDTRRAEPG